MEETAVGVADHHELNEQDFLDKWEMVAAADPLGLDIDMQDLPYHNLHGDGGAILASLSRALSATSGNRPDNEISASAAIRDLDFLISSLDALQINAFDVHPDLGEFMLYLGETANMPPRGTLYTFSLGNPRGLRERSFTGTIEEQVFIESLRVSTGALEPGLQMICDLQIGESSDDDVVNALETVFGGIQALKNANLDVRQAMSSVFFAHNIRPFFDPWKINKIGDSDEDMGIQVNASSAAHMQMLGIDRALWGMNEPGELYQQYFAESAGHMDAHHRSMIARFEGNNEAGLALQVILLQDTVDPRIMDSLVRILQETRGFRYAHTRMAEESEAERLRMSGGEPVVGSASFDLGILYFLRDRTDELLVKLGASHLRADRIPDTGLEQVLVAVNGSRARSHGN